MSIGPLRAREEAHRQVSRVRVCAREAKTGFQGFRALGAIGLSSEVPNALQTPFPRLP